MFAIFSPDGDRMPMMHSVFSTTRIHCKNNYSVRTLRAGSSAMSQTHKERTGYL